MPDLHTLRVAVSLPCKQCGYDLRGMHADGRCPECGLELIESIAARVDPEIARLPSIAQPAAAAWSLLITTVALTTAMIAESLSYASIAIANAPPGEWRDRVAGVLPVSLPVKLVAIPPLSIAVAISATVVLVAATGHSGIRRIALFLGLGGWLVASCLPASPSGLALTGLAAIATLAGLNPIFEGLGQRSRSYRQRPATRQTIGPLSAAIAVGVAASAGGELTARSFGPDAATPFGLVGVACLAMTVIGFLYLSLNAIWIWSALRSWQPLLERVMDREGSPIAAPGSGSPLNGPQPPANGSPRPRDGLR